MLGLSRDQPRLHIGVAAVITIVVWTLYVVRMTFGVGPMHDYDGNQAPAVHYLVGALVVTGMVCAWIIARAILTNHRRG